MQAHAGSDSALRSLMDTSLLGTSLPGTSLLDISLGRSMRFAVLPQQAVRRALSMAAALEKDPSLLLLDTRSRLVLFNGPAAGSGRRSKAFHARIGDGGTVRGPRSPCALCPRSPPARSAPGAGPARPLLCPMPRPRPRRSSANLSRHPAPPLLLQITADWMLPAFSGQAHNTGLSRVVAEDSKVYDFFMPSVVASRINIPHPQPTAREAAEARAARAAAANPVGDDQQEHCCYCGNCEASGYMSGWRSDGTNRFCDSCWLWRTRSPAEFEPAKWGQRPYTQCGAAGCALCKQPKQQGLGKRPHTKGWSHVKKSRTG